MQKLLFIFCLAFVFTACKKSDASVEHRVYIYLEEIPNVSISQVTGVSVGVGVMEEQKQLSKGFWKFFEKQFPAATSKIFLSPVQGQWMRDSNFVQTHIDSITLFFLRSTLPKNTFEKSFPKVELYIRRDYNHFIKMLNDSLKTPVIKFSKYFLQEIKDNKQ